ncbi:MAG: T9SS type A sorting domain-containing protein [Bacteroidota bacterium]
MLPFREDFSYKGPFPDPMLWTDSFALVNQSYAIHPKTIGTATFDAMDQNGEIYEEAENNSYQFSADFLTSHPIRLDSVFEDQPRKLNPADSILLTFYYQPQGIGSAPRDRDSLVVEFLHTPGYWTDDPDNPGEEIWIDDLWVSVWRATGETLEEFLLNNDSVFFKRAAIMIEDETYLRDDFQFRFRNYASFPLSKTPDNFGGNISIWNVDYIMLDHDRSITDDFYYDIAFAAPAQSILKDLRAMPWAHYIVDPQARHKSSFDVAITNLDNFIYNYSYRYYTTDENNSVIRNYSGGTWNIAPFSQQGYQSYQPHANPPLVANPLGTLSPASYRNFRIYHVLREGNTGDEWIRNDTIYFNQVFDNYFAYDDGIPENGYGLVGFNASGAVRFILGKTDTLDAVEFYFNPTLNNQNQSLFRLMVWKNLDPEEVLYMSDPVDVEFASQLHEFVSYPLEEPIEVSDTIYVGWQQMNDEFLNIGFDATGNASQHIFYNSFGQWLPSIYNGALMIRPIFGPEMATGWEEVTIKETLTLYPNPVQHNTLNIGLPDTLPEEYEVHIFDITGKLIAVFHRQPRLDVSGLPNGLYFLRVTTPKGNLFEAERFIIAR